MEFLNVALGALSGQGCWTFARRRPHIAVPQVMAGTDMLMSNYSAFLLDLAASGAHPPPAWLLAVARAVKEAADSAVGLRTFCGVFPAQCVAALRGWGAVWCHFGRRLRHAADLTLQPGQIVSALGTSAAALISEAFPRALAATLAGLANGKLQIPDALLALENATTMLGSHAERAILLGKEALYFGRSRVSRAEFHADVPTGRELDARGFRQYVGLHRADVLLWLLARAAAPSVVELGVYEAELSERLLEEHPTLNWTGVDSFVGGDMTLRGRSGEAILQVARSRLSRWLGGRANLIVSPSVPAAAACQAGSLDLLFVDADHTEQGVAEDLAAWSRCVRPNGIVAGHDYSEQFGGVVRAAHAALPPRATLHLAPDMVFWWYVPEEQ